MPEVQNDIASFSSEPNDLYLSVTDGEFLGMDIIGISDLAPDDTRLSIQVRDNRVSNIQNNSIAAVQDRSQHTVRIHTTTFIAKPSKMSFSYGSSYESMSIIYN